MLDSLRQDVRFAVRSLARRPLFALIAITTLGLGIGGATAMFTVVDGVLVRELPYRDPATLVSVWRAWPDWRGQGLLDGIWDHIQFDLPNYDNVRDHATAIGPVEAHAARRMVMTDDDRSEEVSVGLASAGLFDLLGVRAEQGRTLLPDEALPAALNGARVALVSHQFRVSRFGADGETLGRAIVLNGESYEVVGVLPAGFRLISDMITSQENAGVIDAGLRDVWLPLGRAQAACGNCLEILARLTPGSTPAAARAEIQRLLIDGSDQPNQLARVVGHKARITEGFGSPLLVLFGASGVLLLIACLNVAGLFAGEAAGRDQEMAVRSALGARRGRIVRQLLTESAVLGAVGALAGAWFALLATRVLLSAAPPMPRLEGVAVSLRALAFATLAGVTTGIACGVAPAVGLVGLRGSLRTRGATPDRRMGSLHGSIVSMQLGLTVLLLVAAALFGRSLGRLMSVDPGFRPEQLATLSFDVPQARGRSDEAVLVFQSEVVRAAGAVPGVSSVSLTSELPFPGGKGSRSFALEPDGPMSETAMWHRSVLPGYHETMGIPLLAGRMLAPSDGDGAPDVIVVSQSFAQHAWPGESPLGKRLYRTGPVGEWTVVGVVGDVRHRTLGALPEPTIYRTTLQAPMRRLYLVARTAADPAPTLHSLRRAIWSLDPHTPIAESGVMTTLMRDSEADDRFRAMLVWTFAGLATVLAAIGIFGVTARMVAVRWRELGIRSALGAQGHDLVLLVLRKQLRIALPGIAIGMMGAFWASRLIESLLYGIHARDPLTYAVVGVLASVTCMVAAYVPARRATRIPVADIAGR